MPACGARRAAPSGSPPASPSTAPSAAAGVAWSGPSEEAIARRVVAYRRRIASTGPVERSVEDAAALTARLGLDADDLAMRRGLLKHYVLAGDAARARAQAVELCRRSPDAPWLVYDLGLVLRMDAEAFDDFVAILRGAAGRRPRSDAVLFNCARLLDLRAPPAFRDRGDEALVYFRRSAERSPRTALYRESLAQRLRAARFLEEARDAYASAAALWEVGDRADAYAGIAEVELQVGNLAEARAAAQASLDDNRAGAEPGAHATNRARVLLGLAAAEEGRLPEAGAWLSAAADVQPCLHTESEGIDLRLAEAVAAGGHPDIAHRYARIALLFMPTDRAAVALVRRTSPLARQSSGR